MRKEQLRLVGALALVTAMAGLSTGCGDKTVDPQGSGGTSNAGGQTGSGGLGNSGGQTGSGGAVVVECTDPVNVTPCGGEVAGTWNVTSSCMELSGDMDVTLTSLGCATVPVEGKLQTTGTFIANANGTYSDNTTTTGSVSFPLEPSCLSVSSVPVECNRLGAIFEAVGWSDATCMDTAGQCSCTATVEQQGGMGMVLPYVDLTGPYSTEDNVLTASNASYSYCATGDTLTVTPQMSALIGSLVLQREGTVGGSGGASGSGGGEGSGGQTGSGGDAATGGSDGSGGGPVITATGPCDIYEEAGNACAAAHSTIRALFGSFTGALYQVKRADGMTQDIPVKSPGGFADSAVQDTFCSGSSCTIWRIYDQSGRGNFLEAQTPDSTVGGKSGMTAAKADAESLMVGGNKVYSLFTRPSQAYWNDGSETGMPLGAEPQGIYMVTSGEHYNGGCCYDYGNAQLDRNYHGGPTMDTVYFGSNTIWGTGEGEGPWVMADMEDGMLASGTPGAKGVAANKSLPFPFVTAMEKNDGTTNFALKGGDATSPTLTTMWSGPLPGSKKPMKREGAVIMGAGGDCCYSNNNASEGTFYEGAIVEGYPSDATDEEVHANVVELGYGK